MLVDELSNPLFWMFAKGCGPVQLSTIGSDLRGVNGSRLWVDQQEDGREREDRGQQIETGRNYDLFGSMGLPKADPQDQDT